jgi:transcriptional regulator GlxA family with amidase domain
MIRVACLLYEGFQLLDVAGPLTAFEGAGYLGVAGYSIEILAARRGSVRSSVGACLEAQDFRRSRGCDLLLIPGGFSARHREKFEPLLPFIRKVAKQGRCIASVCSGAYLLAEAGLLNDRVAATHWLEAAELARRHPSIKVDADRLFVRDGNIWTSAGVTAGIDLALAIVERDYGPKVARRVAQGMVVQFRRPGTQSQHSALLEVVAPDNRFNDVLAWARANLSEPLSVEQLASRAALSPRQFSRAFTASIGMSPAKAVERLRLESARAAVEQGIHSLARIATDNGFNTADRLRRAFIRVFGETPRATRNRA